MEENFLVQSIIYKERFKKAPKGIVYSNCAGFAKYMIGLSEIDKFVRTNDSSPEGLITYLEMVEQLKVSEFSLKEYLEKVQGVDVVGFLRNEKDIWKYYHFAVPDPENLKKLYQRGDFEGAPEYVDIEEELRADNEYQNCYLIFFRKRLR